MKTLSILLGLALCMSACGNSNNEASTTASSAIPAPSAINYNIVKVYPHDTASFTEGLIWYNNSLFEGTGLNGETRLMKIDLITGKAGKKISLPNDYFGEGITILNDTLYQLTWKEHKAFVYTVTDFKKIGEFDWPYEGWGLTHNGKQLIISTGGSNLYFVNPHNFKIEKTLGVTDNNGYVGNLNELEMVNGYIYANIYMTEWIVKINPANGLVEGKMDFTNLLERTNQPIYENKDVLNGIAFDTTKNSFYITGKKWPALYEVKLN